MERYVDKLWEAYFLVGDDKVEKLKVVACCEEQARQIALKYYEMFKTYKYVFTYDFIKVVELQENTIGIAEACSTLGSHKLV